MLDYRHSQGIRTWRDTPKPGETDAKWCGSIIEPNGHVLTITTDHETEASAHEWLSLRLKKPAGKKQ